MRKAVVMLLMLWLAAGYPLAGSLYAQQRRRGGAAPAARPVQPETPEAPRGDLFAKFPVGEEKRVDLEIDEDSLDGMSRRERLEQVRDWLLLTTVAASGVSLDAVNQALYDQPSVRHGYMQPLAGFEYGVTRARYVGGGSVVALLPAGSRSRDDLLAHIADQQRKDLGEIPSSLVPFEYRIDLDSNTALLVRRPTITAADLFTEAYGYHQARVGSLADLNDFMARADDVTYSDASGGALTLGGRKIKGRAYGRIGVEEVAAVWQAQSTTNAEVKRLRALRKQLDNSVEARRKQLIDNFDQRWAAFRVGPGRFRIPVEYGPQFREEKAKVASDIEALYAVAEPVARQVNTELAEEEAHENSGAGFSLDPQYDYDRLAECFGQHVEPLLRELMPEYPSLVSARDIEAVKGALAGNDTGPFSQLLAKLSRAGEKDFARHLQTTLNVKCSIQSARYIGTPPHTLRGTEAGMVLFYTDLIAKLWAFNHGTPSRQIRDFKAMPDVAVSPLHSKELWTLSKSRLWFGPRNEGFQITGDAKERLLLARNAARIFSASRDPLKPAVDESEPNAEAAAFISWWDKHYEDIARHEPQYERLNEIMKWSLIAGWLNDKDKGALLGFLDGVVVKRDNWFPDWVAQHRQELRFQNWDKVQFFDRPKESEGTESMPRIFSEWYPRLGEERQLSGGVSLAGRAEVAKRLPLTARTRVGKLLRRAGLDLEASTPGEIKMLEGPTHRVESATAGEAKVVSVPKPTAKLRTTYGELPVKSQVERAISQQGGRYEVKTSVAEVKTVGGRVSRVSEVAEGSLRVEETGNGFKIGRESRDLDVGLALARRVSGSREPSTLLSRSPDVGAAFVLPGRGYLIKTRGSINKWLLMEYAEGPGGTAQARVADLAEGAAELRLKWLDPATAARRLDGGSVGVRLTDESSLNPLLLVGDRPRSATRVVALEKDGKVYRGFFDESTGALYFDKINLPPELRNNPEQLSKLLSTADLRKVNALAAESPGEIRYAPGAVDALPAELARADRLIAEGNGAAALDHLETLERTFPGRWEVQARRGLAQFKRGKVLEAAEVFEALRQNPSTNLKDVYDQISSVLAGLKSGGRWSAADMGGGKFGVELTLPGGLKGHVVRDAAELREGGAVYLPEGLDNPNVSLQNVLMDVIARPSSGTVIRLRRGDIASYNPTVVRDSVSDVRFEFKGTTGGGRPDAGSGARAGADGWASTVVGRARAAQTRSVFFACCDDGDGDGVCDDDEEDARGEDDDDSCVYVVLPPGRERRVSRQP